MEFGHTIMSPSAQGYHFRAFEGRMNFSIYVLPSHMKAIDLYIFHYVA